MHRFYLRLSPAAILRTACSSCVTSRKMRSSSLAQCNLFRMNTYKILDITCIFVTKNIVYYI